MFLFKKYILTSLFIGIVALFSYSKVAGQNADQTHFFYVQSDKNQPFFIVLNHKVYESSSIGYLIISKLKNGDYQFQVGFPKNAYPSQDFQLSVQGNDAGYGLKYINGTWEMINLQTREMLAKADPTTTPTAAKTPTVSEPVKQSIPQQNTTTVATTTSTPKSSFGDMLGQAVGSKKTTSTNSPAKTETTTSTTTVNDNIVTNINPPVPVQVLNTDSSRRGTTVTYIIQNGSSIDTVSTFISNSFDTDIAAAVNNNVTNNVIATTDTSSSNPYYTGASTANNRKVESPVISESSSSTMTSAVNNVRQIQDVICENPTSDKDLQKIKNKMLDKSKSEPDMIAAAEKAIGKKCVTTTQLQLLGNLLLSDASRYAFYTTLFPHVSDQSNFENLSAQLLESSYKSQLKSFIQRN